MPQDITYSEAIELVMMNNGFYASLQNIYKEVGKYKDMSKVKGLTPNNTIQERVQRDNKFTKIGLGVYALTEYIDKLPKEQEIKTEKEEKIRMHTHIQGMLIEIGNMNGYDTYTPDKNGIFINRELGKITTINEVPPFTFPSIIKDSIRFVDVIWFNERGFPAKLFEVENSTDFRAGFIKFNEIQDFRSDFAFVATEERRTKFETEKTKSSFSNIKDRCRFLTYDHISNWYQNQIEGKKFN